MKRLFAMLLTLALLAGAGIAPAAGAEALLACLPVSGLDEAALNNVDLAARAINGYYLPRGSSFSFNEAVGARTEARGYLPAPDADGVEAVGGGAERVATALYQALQGAAASVDYASLAFCADGRTVRVDGADFSFYNYAADMYIEVYTDYEYINCSLTPAAGAEAGSAGSRLAGRASLRVSGTESLKNNIALACGSVNDTVLGPNDLFSFNDTVGPRTPEYGYGLAVNGRGLDVVGGGVAQVASALCLALQQTDCTAIVEKASYGERYNQSYVANPRDAVLVDYENGVDFSFTYTGSGSLAVYAWLADDGELVCELYETTGW